MPPDEFSDIGSVKALLTDARERIKEAEDRGTRKIEDTERRLNVRLDELETQFSKLNVKMIEWLPLLTNLSKTEENKRNATLMLVVSLVTNVCAWIITGFVYYVKSGGVK